MWTVNKVGHFLRHSVVLGIMHLQH